MKLWIDDERPAPEGWHHVRTYATAEIALLAAVESRELTAVSFDHDLGEEDERRSGYGLARVLERLAAEGHMDWFRGELTCHSANPAGAQNIRAALRAVRSFIGY